MVNRKKWAIGYAVLCMLYFAVSVIIPHEKLEPRGLEGIGKPSLRLKTEALTEQTITRYLTGEGYGFRPMTRKAKAFWQRRSMSLRI